ncbi:MAG TPA: hypothetical protein VLI05_01135 [Candidatus Saccharimonadia bacterium]|nr:hypothetical protein [Candidatus Saccharimonadia bacterium]
MDITVAEGDIMKFAGSAVVIPVKPKGDNDDHLNRALREVAGSYYHDKLTLCRAVMPSRCRAIHLVHKPELDLPVGDVIFVIDDLAQPLRKTVATALKEAEEQHLGMLRLPLLRTGEQAGLREEPTGTAAFETVVALREFTHYSRPRLLRDVTCVVNDAETAQQLEQLLALSAP